MQSEVDRILHDTPPGVSWGVSVMLDAEAVASVDPERVYASASMGKVFLLGAVAAGIEAGELDRSEVIAWSAENHVADSGLWQFMPDQLLTVEALAVLVGAVSDNLATNALLERIGLEVVQQVSVAFGVPQTQMLDYLRDVRFPTDPVAPSQARSSDLVSVMRGVAQRRFISPGVSAQVEHWLSLNTDLSMVASAFDLDPLAHTEGLNGIRVFNKTGTDIGVRADAGFVEIGHHRCTYAVIARWNGTSELIRPVRNAMQDLGDLIFAAVVD